MPAEKRPNVLVVAVVLIGLTALITMQLFSPGLPADEQPDEVPELETPMPQKRSPLAPSAPYEAVRRPAVAGSWYPGDAAELATLIDGYLEQGRPAADCGSMPMAVLAPHAGYRFSGPTAGHSFAQVAGCPVRRVWLLGPSHRLRLDGVGLYPVREFETPLGRLPLDTAVMEALAAERGIAWLENGNDAEHSLEMELPLLQRALGAFELVPMLVGRMTPGTARKLADVLRPHLGPGDLVVVSGDFTHHGPNFDYSPFSENLPASIDDLDHQAWQHMAQPDTDKLHDMLESTGATICGRNPLLLLTALLDPTARGEELAYTTSGELTGGWENSVSYLAARFDGAGWKGDGPQTGIAPLVSDEAGQALLELARRSLEHYYDHGKTLIVDPSTLPPGASTTLGAFVTLEKPDGSLRGCIGEIVPRRPVWQAVVDNAVAAATRDSRFVPVSESELDSLHLDISLLGPIKRVRGPADVIVGRHGVVLSKGGRRATYLPQVGPEQGWDRDTMLRSLSRKAGLSESDIPTAAIDVYEGQVFREHE